MNTADYKWGFGPCCEWGFGVCKAPDTNCPHWQGTFCELDICVDEDHNKNKEGELQWKV